MGETQQTESKGPGDMAPYYLFKTGDMTSMLFLDLKNT